LKREDRISHLLCLIAGEPGVADVGVQFKIAAAGRFDGVSHFVRDDFRLHHRRIGEGIGLRTFEIGFPRGLFRCRQAVDAVRGDGLGKKWS
jgi:hypothetical protein